MRDTLAPQAKRSGKRLSDSEISSFLREAGAARGRFMRCSRKRRKANGQNATSMDETQTFIQIFPFSRLREKVPDRADEGVGSARVSSSGEQITSFNTAHTCDFTEAERTPSSGLRPPSPAGGRRGNQAWPRNEFPRTALREAGDGGAQRRMGAAPRGRWGFASDSLCAEILSCNFPGIPSVAPPHLALSRHLPRASRREGAGWVNLSLRSAMAKFKASARIAEAGCAGIAGGNYCRK